jgi:hypothetical protein
VVVSSTVTVEFDAATRTWSSVTNPSDLHARQWGSVAYDSVDRRVLLCGGESNGSGTFEWRPLDDVWAYDPATHVWANVIPGTSS